MEPNIAISIVVIPQCAQVNTAYKSRIEKTGGVFNTNI